MNSHSSQPDRFFPIEEDPVFTALLRNGVARPIRVPDKKAPIAADSGEIISFNTMTDIASRPPKSPRFRRDRPSLERRAGVWLRDFSYSAAQPGFSLAVKLGSLAEKPSDAQQQAAKKLVSAD